MEQNSTSEEHQKKMYDWMISLLTVVNWNQKRITPVVKQVETVMMQTNVESGGQVAVQNA